MKRIALMLMILSLAGSACSSMRTHRSMYPNPNQRLDHMLALYEAAKRSGDACREVWRAGHAVTDCERILREIDRLSIEHPGNERILFSLAALSYEATRREKAQLLLDQLLSRPRAYPEAAVLRSRIALEEGNGNLARDLLSRQIMLAPDRYELREALASAFYVDGRYAEARAALTNAGRLGLPVWRLYYHHGLISEAQRDREQACRYYVLALEQKPDYRPARARLNGRPGHVSCETSPAEEG